ncbi:MAG: hypothetical protein ACT4TC_19665 [Myxococcaceae bacterium]
MNAHLLAQLRALFGPRMQNTRVEPASERELQRMLQLLAEYGASFASFQMIRDRFNTLGPVDERSGLVEAGAGVRLAAIEDHVSRVGFSLGPLSPGILRLSVAEFLEGSLAGARPTVGGRLEPMAIALSALLRDGSMYRSLPSPRSAAGPDLDALFLGGRARAGLLLSATLRLCPRPHAVIDVRFAAPRTIRLLRGALLEGVWMARARLWQEQVEVQLIGSQQSVERDRATLLRWVDAEGGRREGNMAGTAEGTREEEVAWGEVERARAAGGMVTLYRLSAETVLVVGAGRRTERAAAAETTVPTGAAARIKSDALRAAVSSVESRSAATAVSRELSVRLFGELDPSGLFERRE